MNDHISIENLIKENNKLISDINRNVELYHEYIKEKVNNHFSSIDEVVKSSINDIFKLSLKLLETNHYLRTNHELQQAKMHLNEE